MNKRKKFCIVTTARSGSGWLYTLLDSHPQIKAFAEPFIWRKYRPYWTDEEFPSYYNYKNNTPKKSPWTLFKYLDILDTYKVEKDFDIIGFKVMYYQIIENPELLIKIILDRYKIVHLVRQNNLDILISRAALQQNGLAHSTKTTKKTTRVVLNTSSLINDLSRLDRNYKIMRMVLKLMPLSVMEIKYESLLKNRDQVLSLLADFLEVDSTSITFHSEFKRTNSGGYEDKIVNYDQVVAILEGSKYADYLLN